MTPESASETVFFYGLFMDADALREKGLDPGDPIKVCVEGYGLRIGERATLEASETEKVFGTLMTLGTEELERLYGEESVADYVPVKLIAADTDGRRIQAVSYILPMEQLSGRNPEYARALLSVAKKIGLPDQHLKAIESFI